MSLLSTYDPEAAKRVYAEERVEDIVVEMLREGDSIEKIIRITKLSEKTVQELQDRVLSV